MNGNPNENAPYIYIRLDETTHEFDKTNMVSIPGRGTVYDRYRCDLCGLEGNRYGISAAICVPNKKKNPPTNYCPEAINWDDPEEDEYTWK